MDEHSSAQQERRQYNPKSSDLWAYLTLEQRHAVSNLSNFGYELKFIRKVEGVHGIAFLFCGENKATVDLDGNIQSDPPFNIRPSGE
jgi:hypothetical protein